MSSLRAAVVGPAPASPYAAGTRVAAAGSSLAADAPTAAASLAVGPPFTATPAGTAGPTAFWVFVSAVAANLAADVTATTGLPAHSRQFPRLVVPFLSSVVG